MIVEVVAVGTELLLGQIVNSNAAEIGRRLADAGMDHFHQTVVGDNLDRIAHALRTAAARADAVIITGGIGPTQDDLTREALCLALGRSMAFSDDYAVQLRSYWERRGRAMPEQNLRQAEYPAGGELIPNPKGSAPGIRVRADGGAWLFALPGVPQEMLPMLEHEVIPFLAHSGDGEGVLVSRLLRTWGEGESRIAELLGDLFEEAENPTMAFLASSGEIKVRLTARAGDEAAARALIAPVEAEVRNRLGPRVFGADADTLETIVFRMLDERGWSIGTAESATGGKIAARLTDTPGASEWYRGSVVAYHEDLKRDLLDVPAETITAAGVVSEAVAEAMAEGAAARLEVDVAVAVTGSAGPDGLERRVGTMIIAVRTPEATRAKTLHLPGDRERVRTYATTAALQLTRLAISGHWWTDDEPAFGRPRRPVTEPTGS